MIKKVPTLLFISSLILALSSCAPVTIHSSPDGADVYSADGTTQLGTTPFDTRVFVSEKNLILRKNGYFDEPVTLNYDSERDINATCRPTPLLIYSKPIAEIYPSGSETSIGTTPMYVQVTDQASTYTLKAADYYDQEISVSINDAPAPLVAELTRRPIITLSAKPDGVEIYEKNKLLGTTPFRIEVLSPRTIEMRKTGYFTKTVKLNGKPPYEISAELNALPRVTISASPSTAKIYRKKRMLAGGRPKVSVLVGEKTDIEIMADRFYPQTITLDTNSPSSVKVELKAMPYVMINSKPSGAEVMINGKSVGMTPVEQLIENDTVVELRKEGFATQTATLTGKDASVTLTLETVNLAKTDLSAQEAAEKATAAKIAAEKAAAEKAAAEKAAAEKAAKQRNMMLTVGGAAAIIVAAIAVLLMKKKKQ